MQDLDTKLAHIITATAVKIKNASINLPGATKCGGTAHCGKKVNRND